MTQFIVASGEFHRSNLPPGIGIRPPSDSLVSRVAAMLFPGESCFQVFDLASGEANRLFDDLHARLNAPGGEAHDHLPVVMCLKALVADGHGIACWYAEDYSELPRFDAWEPFIREVLRQASQMPPEIYAIIRPKKVISGESTAS